MPKSNSTKRFAVVAFPDEVDNKGNCSLEVIPAAWLIGRQQTYWPAHLKRIADLSEAVANCIHPSNEWDKWRIKILEESDDLAEANNKANTLLYTSHCDTSSDSEEEVRPKRKRCTVQDKDSDNDNEESYENNGSPIKKRMPYKGKQKQNTVVRSKAVQDRDSDNDNEENNENNGSPSFKKPVPYKRKKKQNNTVVKSKAIVMQKVSADIDQVTRCTPTPSNHLDHSPDRRTTTPIAVTPTTSHGSFEETTPLSTPRNSGNDDNEEEEITPASLATLYKRFIAFEKICLTQVANIRYENKRLHRRLESMERTSLTANDQSPAAEAALEWRSLPVKTDGAFLALALELSDELKMESLIKRLASVGGDDYLKMTYEVLGHLMSKSVCLLYSIEGKQKKKSMTKEAFNVYRCVIESVKRKFPDCTDKKIRARMGMYLAQASDREGGRRVCTPKRKSDSLDRREDAEPPLLPNLPDNAN